MRTIQLLFCLIIFLVLMYLTAKYPELVIKVCEWLFRKIYELFSSLISLIRSKAGGVASEF